MRNENIDKILSIIDNILGPDAGNPVPTPAQMDGDDDIITVVWDAGCDCSCHSTAEPIEGAFLLAQDDEDCDSWCCPCWGDSTLWKQNHEAI